MDHFLSKTCDAGHGLVANIIDVKQEEGSLVAAGVSDRLDQLKATYQALPGFLTRVVEAELARIPRALSHNLSQQTWTCVYVPQACPCPCPNDIPGRQAARSCCCHGKWLLFCLKQGRA